MSVPVTCIVPTYNRVEYLGEAIDSILAQTCPPERVLVVDDGSTDGTASHVARFGSRVDYVFKPNGGKSSALNCGLRETTSPYVWIFDDDDVADRDALSRMYDALDPDEGLGFVFGPYRIFEKVGPRTIVQGPESLYFPIVDDTLLLVAQLRHSFVHQPGLLVRKRCYDAVGPFDETMLRSQDYEMMLRLSRAFVGKALVEPLFSQRRHSGVRGTSRLKIVRKDVQRIWKSFDQEIIRRAHTKLHLAEFLSKDRIGCALSRHEQISARLERASLMAGRGLWAEAIEDLQAVIQIAAADAGTSLQAHDRLALQRFFGPFSDGLEELAPHIRHLSEVLARSRGVAADREMRINLAWGLPYRFAASIAKRRMKRALLAFRALTAISSIYLPLLLASKTWTLLGMRRASGFGRHDAGSHRVAPNTSP